MSIVNLVRKEIIKYLYESEEYFSSKLPDEVKKQSNKYVGRNVIWYGDPNQMIVVHKDNVHGMWGNIYDREKLGYVENLVRNSEDYVEFECSYALGGIVDLQDIVEHQQAYLTDNFSVDYDGHDEPYTTGSDEVDKYLGTEDITDLDFMYNLTEDDTVKFFEEHKLDLVYNENNETQLRNLFNGIKPDEDELNAFEEFINIEEELKATFANKTGDIGEFKVQLRDAHHRVMGAIDAGEEYICVNLENDDLAQYNDHITKVTNKA